MTACSVAAALRAAGSGLNRASFVQDLGPGHPATLQRQPVPVSRTHELLMHLAYWLWVCVTIASEGRGSSGDRCRAGVKSVTSFVYHMDFSDLTLGTELSVSENKTLECARCAFFNIHARVQLVRLTRINYWTWRKKTVLINVLEHLISGQWIICA